MLQRWKVVLVEINLKSTRHHVVGASGFVGGAIFGGGVLGRDSGQQLARHVGCVGDAGRDLLAFQK